MFFVKIKVNIFFYLTFELINSLQMCIYIYVGEGVGPWASCFVICKDIVHMTRLLIKAVTVDELIF